MARPAHRFRFAILAAALTLAVAGCINGGTATGAPTAAPTAAPSVAQGSDPVSSAQPSSTAAPPASASAQASAAPSVGPTGSAAPLGVASAGPSASANEHMVPALEALLPATFNGVTLRKQSYDGTVLGSDAASRQLQQFLAANGKRLSDFGEAGATDPANKAGVTFVVFRVPGINGNVLQQAIVAASVAASPKLTVGPATVGGKSVVQGTDDSGTRYIYTKDDLVYGVQGMNQALATQALATLP